MQKVESTSEAQHQCSRQQNRRSLQRKATSCISTTLLTFSPLSAASHSPESEKRFCAHLPRMSEAGPRKAGPPHYSIQCTTVRGTKSCRASFENVNSRPLRKEWTIIKVILAIDRMVEESENYNDEHGLP